MMIGIGQKKPDPPMPRVPAGTVTVASVLPRTAFNTQVAGRYFVLDECPKCQEHQKAPCDLCDNYASIKISAVVEGVDMPMAADGSGRKLEVVPAAEIAESLVNAEASDRGVFIAGGEQPTHEELVEARRRFVAWGETLVKQADDIWGAKKDAKLIDPRAHDCAKYLGLNREWLSNTTAQTACRICGRYAKTGVILGECGHPADWAKAQTFGLLTPQMEAFAISEGLIAAAPDDEEPIEVAEGDEAPAPVKRGKRGPYKKRTPALTDVQEPPRY